MSWSESIDVVLSMYPCGNTPFRLIIVVRVFVSKSIHSRNTFRLPVSRALNHAVETFHKKVFHVMERSQNSTIRFRSRVKKLRFSRAPPALEEKLEVGALPVVCRVEPFPE